MKNRKAKWRYLLARRARAEKIKLCGIKECRQTKRNPKQLMLFLLPIILFIFIFIPFYFHQQKSLLLITRNMIFSHIFICHYSLKSTTLNIWILKDATGEVPQREEKAGVTTGRVHTMPSPPNYIIFTRSLLMGKFVQI